MSDPRKAWWDLAAEYEPRTLHIVVVGPTLTSCHIELRRIMPTFRYSSPDRNQPHFVAFKRAISDLRTARGITVKPTNHFVVLMNHDTPDHVQHQVMSVVGMHRPRIVWWGKPT